MKNVPTYGREKKKSKYQSGTQVVGTGYVQVVVQACGFMVLC